MAYRIVFSDVDGTLLDSAHRLSPGTLYAIEALRERGIPFVIVSARSPSGIYPIQEEYGFRCPVISYSGGLLLDENRNVLHSDGFSAETARQVIRYIEERRFDCTWNLYYGDTWIVRDRRDPRVRREEEIVRARAAEGTPESLPDGTEVGKILCMCRPECLSDIERQLQAAFPALSVVRSSEILLEIMQKGVSKGNAVRTFCQMQHILPEEAVAFGDHYNDVAMLEAVGMPYLMGNAPQALKDRFPNVTDSNDDDGICHALTKLGLVPRR